MESLSVTKLVILFYLIASNLLKYKWITYLRNILYHSKKCDFLKCRHLYSDFVCASSTSHFEMPYFSESRKSLDFLMELKFCKSDLYFLKKHKKCVHVGGHS